MLGDCLERMKEIPDGSVDMVLTDLPYGTTRNKWDSVIDLPSLWAAWKRVCKPGAPTVLFTQQPFTTTVAASNLKQLKTEWIIEKPQGTNFLNATAMPMKVHENVLVFCDRKPAYFPQKTLGHSNYVQGSHRGSTNYGVFTDDRKRCDDGSRYPRSVLKFTPERGLHPTQKSVPLLEYFIKTYSLPGMTVLDCTMGSGSTLVACVNTGRKGIGIEKDEAYFAIAEERIAAIQPPALPEAA